MATCTTSYVFPHLAGAYSFISNVGGQSLAEDLEYTLRTYKLPEHCDILQANVELTDGFPSFITVVTDHGAYSVDLTRESTNPQTMLRRKGGAN